MEFNIMIIFWEWKKGERNSGKWGLLMEQWFRNWNVGHIVVRQ